MDVKIIENINTIGSRVRTLDLELFLGEHYLQTVLCEIRMHYHYKPSIPKFNLFWTCLSVRSIAHIARNIAILILDKFLATQLSPPQNGLKSLEVTIVSIETTSSIHHFLILFQPAF